MIAEQMALSDESDATQGGIVRSLVHKAASTEDPQDRNPILLDPEFRTL
jgi:hypothetical protein